MVRAYRERSIAAGAFSPPAAGKAFALDGRSGSAAMEDWQDDPGRPIHSSDLSSLFAMCWFRRDDESKLIWQALRESTTRWNVTSMWVNLGIGILSFLNPFWLVHIPSFRFWMCFFGGLACYYAAKQVLFAEYYRIDKRWVFRWRSCMLRLGRCPACTFELPRSLPATCTECGCSWTATSN